MTPLAGTWPQGALLGKAMLERHRSRVTLVLKPRSFRRSHRQLVSGAILLLAPILASGVAWSQDERSRTDPTQWWWYHGVSEQFITQAIKDKGARIVDIEVEQTSPYRFAVVMIRNQGAYAKSWWWYYGLKGVGAVADKVKQHSQALILDLEVVEVDYGDGKGPQYTIVLVENAGARAGGWWPEYNGSVDGIASKIDKNRARLTDLETNLFVAYGNQLRYSAVMVANEGTDRKSWWWYVNVSPDLIELKLKENNAQLTDMEWNGAGKFSVIMEKSAGGHWWWFFDKPAADLTELAQKNGARIIDIETYWVDGKRRFAAIMLQNRGSQ